MKTKLTSEQSQCLIELGVDPSKASCEEYVDTGKIKNGIELPPQPKRVFKLTDILAILPEEIDSCQLYMIKSCRIWNVGYGVWRDLNDFKAYYQTLDSEAPELIDSLFELLCWTLTREKNEKG